MWQDHPEKDQISLAYKIVNSINKGVQTSGIINTAEGYSGAFSDGDNSNSTKECFAITGIKKGNKEATVEIYYKFISKTNEESSYNESILLKEELPRKIIVDDYVYIIIELCQGECDSPPSHDR